MDCNQQLHILIVIFPLQSHISPVLELASRLLRAGVLVTIVTTAGGAKRMRNSGSMPAGLSFANISDGYDDGFKFSNNAADNDAYMSSLRRRGSETLSELIAAGPADGRPPYSAVAYTILLSWVGEVARRHSLPSAVLWIQNAALFALYYHYFNGYSQVIDKCDENDHEWCIKLPSLPLLHAKDLPSFITPSNPYASSLELFGEQFAELEHDENPIILLNSFDALEQQILDSFKTRFRVLAVGPLLSSSFLEKETTPSDTFRVDMYKRSEDDYLAWLDTQPNNSVVYVSFGSISVLSRAQMEELAAALVLMGRPFIWVVRRNPEEEEEELPRKAELREKGLVVTWCSQVDVLSHKAVGCFVTHCGWNSTIESLTAGVPVVGMPQWTDQPTNAKMTEVWGMGVWAAAGEEKVVGREEIRRCVEAVMESEDMRRSARRWRELAMAAVKEGGSSEVNLREYVEVVRRISITRSEGNREEL